MSDPTENDRNVRRFEIELDDFHNKFVVWRRPVNEIVYGLLATFDSYMVVDLVVLQKQGKIATMAALQKKKLLQEGLVVSMRWVAARHPNLYVTPSSEYKLIQHCHELFWHAKTYAILSVFYGMYSQNRADARVDLDTNEVMFILKTGGDMYGFLETTNTYSSEFNEVSTSDIPEKGIDALCKIPHSLEDGRIVIQDFNSLAAPEIRRFTKLSSRIDDLLELSDDLGGFTVAEFNRFWWALRSWSQCCSYIYLSHTQNGMPQEQCMPTQVVSVDFFIKTLANLALIETAKSALIMERLAYVAGDKKEDIFLHPLVCGAGSVAWSTSVVESSAHQRNILKAMSRTPALKAIADNIIGKREGRFVDKIKLRLKEEQWAVYPFIKITDGEVDILCYSPQDPSTVLLIEIKTVLDADDPNELKTATREMIFGQGQIENAMSNLDEIRGRIPIDWTKVTQVHGAVISPNTEPGVDLDQTRIPGIAWTTICSRLKPSDWLTPKQFWSAIMTRPWAPRVSPDTPIEYDVLKVGKMRFRLPLSNL